MSGANVYISPVARSVPFDNQTNSFNALNSQSAIEEATLIALFGAGSDGDLILSSGTTNLPRTMYYNNVTLSGTAVVNTNGYKMYVRGTLSLLDNAVIQNNGGNGTNAVTTTPGTGGAAAPGIDVGASTAGTAGTATGQPTNATSLTGYGGSGGSGGDGGRGVTNTSTGGVLTYLPEHIIRHNHFYAGLNIKRAGCGGSGGIGGAQPLFSTRGAGGGGGGGGGAVLIFARVFGSSSTIGVRALGGNGGNGANGSGNNGSGGGGGAGGGGGFIYIIALDIVAGNISVAGGSGGTAGTGVGTGTAGTPGDTGSVGHTAIYNGRLGSWTVT